MLYHYISANTYQSCPVNIIQGRISPSRIIVLVLFYKVTIYFLNIQTFYVNLILRQIKKSRQPHYIYYNSCRDYCVLGLPLCHQACLQCFLSITNRAAIPVDMRQGIHAAYLPVVISARRLPRHRVWRGSNLCLPTWKLSAWRCSGYCAPAGLSRSPVLSWHRRGPSSPCRSDR